MKLFKKLSVLISVLTVICMMSTNIAPIFAEGTTSSYTLIADENEIELSREPEQDEMGYMVGVQEFLEALGITYEYDDVLDSFEIFLDSGNVMLMHNATHYYKGEDSVECQPYFTVSDIPLIEIGFLCQLIEYEYEIKSEEKVIILTKIQEVQALKTSENVDETPTVDESETTEVTAQDETTEGISVEGEPVKESTIEEQTVETANIEEGIMPMSAASGSSGGGASGSPSSGSTSSSSSTSSELSGNGTLSGIINLPVAAPEGGLSISLILQNTRDVYGSLYGTTAYYYVVGSKYTVATIDFAEGETSKTYTFDAGAYQDSSSYDEYAVFYETNSSETIDKKGYLKKDGTTQYTSRTTIHGEWRDDTDFKVFEFGKDSTQNISISEKDMSCGDNAIWVYDKKTKTLTVSGSGDIYDYCSYSRWEDIRDEVVSVAIEDGITSIGEDAFYWFSALQNVSIPNSVQNIGAGAFCDCYNLKSVVIPDGVTEIYSNTFNGCSNMSLAVIPDTVTIIENHAFDYYGYGSESGYRVNIAYKGSESDWNKISGVSNFIGNKYFNYKEIIKVNNIEYLIKNDSTAIVIAGTDDEAVSVTIPETVNGAAVTEIAAGAFSNKTNLISVSLPNSLKKIGKRAFYECTGLIGVSVRDNVEIIDDEAFYNCTSLTNITMPKELTEIGESAFEECENLTKVTIPDKVLNISDNAFRSCGSLKELTISDSVETIGVEAFGYCHNLSLITLGSSIKTIGNSAFHSYNGNRNVYISNIEAWCNIDFESASSNPLYDDYGELYLNGELAENVVIPESVTHIKPYAFYGCSSLKNIALHEKIESIGEYSFYYCNNLVQINLPNSIEAIGKYAFYNCALNSIELQNKLEIIEEYSFYGCDFETVTIPASVIAIKAYAFAYCYNLAELTVSSTITQIVGTAFNTSGLKIYGLIGSAAETYASSQGYEFEAMDDVVYTITFDANGGESTPSNQSKGFGTPISLTREYPVKKHCTFLGWSTSADGAVEYLSGDTFNDDKDTTLYAIWAEPIIYVENKTGVIGREVTVPIIMENNPGIAGLELELSYDSVLTLTNIQQGSALEGMELTLPGEFMANPVNIILDATEANTSNGEFILLTFKVDENVLVGDYDVSVTVKSARDQGLEAVNINTINGVISTIDCVPGDVNDDNLIDIADVILMRRYIVGGYGISIIEDAADVNDDDLVDIADVILLRRYIVGGYGVVLK